MKRSQKKKETKVECFRGDNMKNKNFDLTGNNSMGYTLFIVCLILLFSSMYISSHLNDYNDKTNLVTISIISLIGSISILYLISIKKDLNRLNINNKILDARDLLKVQDDYSNGESEY